MRIATFNIRNGRAFDGGSSWPFRRRATLRVIEALDADVVGLQEVYDCQLRWLRRRLPGYAVLGAVGRNGGRRGEMNPVLVRQKLAPAGRAEVRWFGDSPDTPGTKLPGAGFPRLAVVLHLRPPGSPRTVQVVNTHLDEKVAANRVRSVQQILEWTDPALPRVVMGDLNARPEREPLAVLARAGLRPVIGADAGGTAHDFTGQHDGAQIDHILVSPEWDVVSSEIRTDRPGGRLPSDHWPLLAELRLRAED